MSPFTGQSHVSLELNGATVEADVVRSDTARTTRIQVGRDRPLRIIVPEGASDEYAVEALRNKSAWVLRKLDEAQQERAQPNNLALQRSDVVWLNAEGIPVQVADVKYAQLSAGVLLTPAQGTEGAVLRWYRRMAGAWLRDVVAEEAARLQVEVKSVAVRDQRTRWGSCSRHGQVSLNWRLLLVPEDVARYVVIHELVHTRIPNHSKAFWRQLGLSCPDWQQRADWLKRHGDEVRRYAYRRP